VGTGVAVRLGVSVDEPVGAADGCGYLDEFSPGDSAQVSLVLTVVFFRHYCSNSQQG
jgi:hypothetical protein